LALRLDPWRRPRGFTAINGLTRIPSLYTPSKTSQGKCLLEKSSITIWGSVFGGVSGSFLLDAVHLAVKATVESDDAANAGFWILDLAHREVRCREDSLGVPPLCARILKARSGAIVAVVAALCVVAASDLSFAWREVAETGRLTRPNPSPRVIGVDLIIMPDVKANVAPDEDFETSVIILSDGWIGVVVLCVGSRGGALMWVRHLIPDTLVAEVSFGDLMDDEALVTDREDMNTIRLLTNFHPGSISTREGLIVPVGSLGKESGDKS